MKRTVIAGLILCGALVLTAAAQKPAAPKPQTAEAALGAAIHQEEAEGNLEAAIASYKKFLAQYSSNRPLAAKAQYHLGLAYEKLGNAGARKAYERVTREFADQKDVAADASRRLAALSIPPISDKPRPRLVMAGDSVDTSASISGDGRWLAITEWSTADGDLGVRELSTGQVKRLQTGTCGTGSKNCTFANLPVFSPDARQVAYTWYDDTEINGGAQLRVIANEVGAKPRVLVRNPEFNIWPRAWTPDGKSILVAMRRPDRTWQLGWVSVSDGSVKVVKSLEWRFVEQTNFEGKLNNLSLSPDGRSIAYSALAVNPEAPPSAPQSTDQHIYLLAADGSKEVELVKSAVGSPASAWHRHLHSSAHYESVDERESRAGAAAVFRQAALARWDARVRELSRSQAGVLGRAGRRARHQRGGRNAQCSSTDQSRLWPVVLLGWSSGLAGAAGAAADPQSDRTGIAATRIGAPDRHENG